MTDHETSRPLALRPGQADWETEMWAHAIVALIVDGDPPPVPLLIPNELLGNGDDGDDGPWHD